MDSGVTRLTHIRPARAKASEVGSLARFRRGYRKNSFFGPFCEVISSRLISNISELSAVETTYLAPEFKSVERLRSRDWARATKIEVLVLQTYRTATHEPEVTPPLYRPDCALLALDYFGRLGHAHDRQHSATLGQLSMLYTWEEKKSKTSSGDETVDYEKIVRLPCMA